MEFLSIQEFLVAGSDMNVVNVIQYGEENASGLIIAGGSDMNDVYVEQSGMENDARAWILGRLRYEFCYCFTVRHNKSTQLL